jgi:hypothetical protein
MAAMTEAEREELIAAVLRSIASIGKPDPKPICGNVERVERGISARSTSNRLETNDSGTRGTSRTFFRDAIYRTDEKTRVDAVGGAENAKTGSRVESSSLDVLFVPHVPQPQKPSTKTWNVAWNVFSDVPRIVKTLRSFNPDQPPGDVPVSRWRQFLADALAFETSGLGNQARSLGWSAGDLYGCDDELPFARIDQAGLVWLLDGARVAFIGERAAGIITHTGGKQTYRRRADQFRTHHNKSKL